MVIGLNSIAAYLMAHLWERFFLDTFRIHLGAHAFAFLGTPYEPLLRRTRGADGLLAGALVDVPAQAIFENLAR